MTDRLFALFLILFVVGVLGAGQYVDHYRWGVVRMPLVMGAICVAALVFVVIFPRPPVADELEVEGEAHALPRPELRRDLSGMAQVLVALPLFWLLGFVAGPAVYVAAVVKYHRHGWGTALILGVLTGAVAYAAFVWLLRVPLPLGPVIGR